MSSTHGASLVELLVVVLVAALSATFAAPALSQIGSELRTAAAARELVQHFQALRWVSTTTGRSHGLLFGQDASGWHWHRVADSNGNGVRVAEVGSGVDEILSGPHRLEDHVPHVHFGFHGKGPYPRIPPGKGWLTGLDDPIRIGNTDLVAFGPLGTSTSGSFYLTDGQSQAAVVLYGGSVRIRVWRWEPGASAWRM